MKQQLKASVPDELVAQLEAAAAKADRSLSAEIAARLEASFADVVDKPTADFIAGMAPMPAEVELETGAAWHKHVGAWAVFRGAILSRLETFKPKGSAAFGDRPHATVLNDDPDQLGALIEFRLRRQPDFSNSPTRQLMEEEHRRMWATMGKRGTKPVVRETPKAELPTFEQLTKGEKKS